MVLCVEAKLIFVELDICKWRLLFYFALPKFNKNVTKVENRFEKMEGSIVSRCMLKEGSMKSLKYVLGWRIGSRKWKEALSVDVYCIIF